MKVFLHLNTGSGGSQRVDADRRLSFCSAEALSAVASAAESAGFFGVHATEHPFPSIESMNAGIGHQSLDPVVSLTIAAAATRTLRVCTYVYVLPYRNPFLAARSLASLDVASGGRLVVGLGAGYMKGEFAALGADIARRNELLDEGILAMKAAWSGNPVTLEGSGGRFRAEDNLMLPRPVQRPHPPIYIGGNSRRAARRAGLLADGYLPFARTPNLVKGHTQAIHSDAALKEVIALAQSTARSSGRPMLEIRGALSTLERWRTPAFDTGELREEVSRLREEIGFNLLFQDVPGDTWREHADNVLRFGQEVLPHIHQA